MYVKTAVCCTECVSSMNDKCRCYLKDSELVWMQLLKPVVYRLHTSHEWEKLFLGSVTKSTSVELPVILHAKMNWQSSAYNV